MLTTRTAIAAFDDVRHAARLAVPRAETILVAWARSSMSCAVVGLVDDDGAPLDPKPEVMARLTALFPRPVNQDLLRLAYPDSLDAVDQSAIPEAERAPGLDGAAGQVLLRIPVDEPEWARVADHVLECVRAGLWVQDSDVRDALWAVLAAMGLPDGKVRVRRVAAAPSFPGEPLFAPVELIDGVDENRKMSWAEARDWLPVHGARDAIVDLSSELAERDQRERTSASSEGVDVALEVTLTL